MDSSRQIQRLLLAKRQLEVEKLETAAKDAAAALAIDAKLVELGVNVMDMPHSVERETVTVKREPLDSSKASELEDDDEIEILEVSGELFL